MCARLFLLLLLLAASPIRAAGTDPFSVSARLDGSGSGLRLVVDLAIPPEHIVYADTFKVKVEGAAVETISASQPHEKMDTFTSELKKVFDSDIQNLYRVKPSAPQVKVRVEYQGCDAEVCFFPQKKNFTLPLPDAAPVPGLVPVPPEPAVPAPAVVPVAAVAWSSLLEKFEVAGTASGYLKTGPFLAFLGGGVPADGGGGRSLILTLLLILLGGAALNLTPCVLPLVPINLAILGAGTRAASKRQGFLLGGLYGLAIAAVYGALGIAVVLFGAKFGALNSSVAFNVVIAVVFVLMALAMFDVIQVDLSRFHSSAPGSGASRGKYAAALVAGAVSALLAGACVAPAVISALVLSASLYAEGNRAAALIPFLLGAGMGLPWPFAGAGLSVLPKPGAWMVRVKQAMGALILILAFYYGYVAWSVLQAQREDTASRSIAELERALEQSLQDGRPVFVDFWATWCKNCEAMEATTFKDPAVVEKFSGLHVVKFQAEQPSEPPALPVLDRFKVVGLPTYVVLQPKP